MTGYERHNSHIAYFLGGNIMWIKKNDLLVNHPHHDHTGINVAEVGEQRCKFMQWIHVQYLRFLDFDYYNVLGDRLSMICIDFVNKS